MPPITRKRRYFGLTSRQISLLAVVAVMNCLIVGSALALILSPRPSSITLASPLPTQAAALAPTALATSRFPPTWTPTPTRSAPPTRTPAPTTPTPKPTPTLERPTIVGWNELASYRLQFRMRLGTEPESEYIQWKVTHAWVKQPPAIHTTITMAGTGLPGAATSTQVETIVIGDKTWGRVGGGEWRLAYYWEAQDMHGNWEGIEKAFRRLQPAGEEVIDGIRCKHYLIDENVTGLVGFGFAHVTAHAQGDLWLANEPDLPVVGVRLRVQLRTNDWYKPRADSGLAVPTRSAAQTTKSVFDLEYDLSDLNAPIRIRPPAGFQ